MTVEIERLTRELAQLPASSQAFLADWLATNLEAKADPEVEAAWNETVDRRWAELEGRQVQTIPAGEAFARARAAPKLWPK